MLRTFLAGYWEEKPEDQEHEEFEELLDVWRSQWWSFLDSTRCGCNATSRARG